MTTPHHAGTVVRMMTGASFRVRVDDKRRPALPKELLDAAGVGAGDDLIARVEAPGRIVLEDAATVLGRLQAAVAAGRAAHRSTGSLAEELLTERAADTSLDPAPPVDGTGSPDSADGAEQVGDGRPGGGGAGAGAPRR